MNTAQLRAIAPAIFAEHQNYNRTSQKYCFISSEAVLAQAQELGWPPIQARQTRVKDLTRAPYARHLVTFQNDGLEGTADAHPRIYWTNSHEGSASGELFVGLFRTWCRNSLIAGSGICNVRIRH